MIKNSYVSPQITYALRLTNDLNRVRLGKGKVNFSNELHYDLYEKLKDSNELNKVNFHKESVHQAGCRMALVDNLNHDFHWDYWMVVTFGYCPDKSLINCILSDAHYRFDRWLLTNLKLSKLNVSDRSKWVCLPEVGENGHLHFNCFIQLNERPETKTYGNEWNTIRLALKTTFKALQKTHNSQRIDYKLYERERAKGQLAKAIYSTKEMTQEWVDKGTDHFATFIRSWIDWEIKPINKRSPKKLESRPKPSANLEAYMN